MSTASTPSPIRRESALAGQTVVVIGGSAGIGLETARLARAEGAKLILAGLFVRRRFCLVRHLPASPAHSSACRTLRHLIDEKACTTECSMR